MQHKVVAASYHIHAQMSGPTCHPSFHYSSSWAIAFVLPDPSLQTNGSITMTSLVSGYTYVSGTTCTTTHQGHVTASLDTMSNEQYGYASATAHMSVSTNVTRNVAYDDPDNSTTTDPVYSTGINFTYSGTVHCPTFGYVLSVSNLNSPYRILAFRTKSQTGDFISSDALASYFNESPFCLNVLIPIWDPSKLTVSPPNSIPPAFTWSENVGYQEYKGGPVVLSSPHFG